VRKAKALQFLASLSVGLALDSCATVSTYVSDLSWTASRGPYSGTTIVLQQLNCWREYPDRIMREGDMDFIGPLKVFPVVVDLPLSFAADTITLPFAYFEGPGCSRDISRDACDRNIANCRLEHAPL